MGYVNEHIMFFLITIELGIVVIVIAALWSISNYEKRIAEETKNILKAKMTLMGCPDYHTQGANNLCSSNYTTPDGRLTYIFSGDSNNVSLASYVNKSVDEACANYSKNVIFTDAQNSVTYKYPWTEMAAKCDIL